MNKELYKKNLPWVEKYRPQTISEISSQYHIVNSIKKSLINGNLPHLLFYGPSGCGKTTTILAIARDMFDKESWEERVLEFNASDERGINVIRDKIKVFAKNSINNKENSTQPNWKLIILDEADSMTTDSQFALRRIMETYSRITRFCIICNYINKIIDPIASRCAKYRFKPLMIDSMTSRLKYICDKENINCDDAIFKEIIEISRGDMRKAINFLQRSYNAYGRNMNVKTVEEISGYISNNETDVIFDIIKKKDFDNLLLKTNSILNDGYSAVNIITKLYNKILDYEIEDIKKAKIIIKLMEVDNHLVNGCDEYIQLLKALIFIYKNIND